MLEDVIIVETVDRFGVREIFCVKTLEEYMELVPIWIKNTYKGFRYHYDETHTVLIKEKKEMYELLKPYEDGFERTESMIKEDLNEKRGFTFIYENNEVKFETEEELRAFLDSYERVVDDFSYVRKKF